MRREERRAAKRTLRGGGKRRGIRQSEEVRENRGHRQEVNRRCGRGRWEEKDRGGRESVDMCGLNGWSGRRKGGGVQRGRLRHLRASKTFWSCCN